MEASNERTKYYEDAFKLIDQGGYKWNWAAAMLGVCWMLYRKMYLYASAVILAKLFVLNITLGLNLSRKTFSIVGFGLLLLQLFLLGRYGNHLYYNLIRKRIEDGYHLMEQYKSTSVSLSLFMLMGGYVSFIIIAIYAYADSIANAEYFKTHPKGDRIVGMGNIKLYLDQNQENHKEGTIAEILSIIVCITSIFVVFKYGYNSNNIPKHHTEYSSTKVIESSNTEHISF